MRVIHVAPPFLALSDDMGYGGIERVINSLRRSQKELGQETDVIAASDSSVYGLLPTVKSFGTETIFSKTPDIHSVSEGSYRKLMHAARFLEYARHEKDAFFHVHDDNLLPFLRQLDLNRFLFTIHNDYDTFWPAVEYPELTHSDMNIVAISRRHKEIYEQHGYSVMTYVYNGIDVDRIPFSSEKSDYVLSLSAIIPIKGQDIAARLAKDNGWSLILAGNVGDQDYFDTFKDLIDFDISGEVDKSAAYRSLPNRPKLVYAGHVNDEQKFPLYRDARAFIMLTQVDEPFGLVVPEALAAGTPVVALARGAMPELIESGITGYICDDVSELASAVEKTGDIDPRACRASAVNRFSSRLMAQRYLELYSQIWN
jgi:glycosyltransferase involved in cell wall biosynthesis